ncbi:MAG TPA: PilZ domain-containing protein [Longimicrobiaceae bacterium]|nr:PilZ domain-containing protein [Longimicrobiaceae bacterium]
MAFDRTVTSSLTDPRRRFIRHTADVPLEVRTVRESAVESRRGVNVSFGGLAFESDGPVPHGTTLQVRIDQVKPPFEAHAQVVHCEPEGDHFCIGVQFLDAADAFRARMVEQVCSIERYRREVRRREGRVLSGQQAAEEWIHENAARFPDPV